jgi:hypothetical protein
VPVCIALPPHPVIEVVTSQSSNRCRPDPFRHQTFGDDIEVTLGMIKAARILLWDEQVSPWEDRDEVLAKIYRAMEMERRRGNQRDQRP